MRNRLTLTTAALLAAAALCGCQTAPVAPAPALAWTVRRPMLQALARFDLDGRVAVAVGKQGFDAGLRWSQVGAMASLTLSGPLGAGGVKVTEREGSLRVITSSGQHLGNAAARAELLEKLGFEPPITSLRYWMLGVPDPATSAQVTLGSEQRAQIIEQSGWRIEYRSYMPVGADWLPRFLTLRHSGVRVRMLVDQWQL